MQTLPSRNLLSGGETEVNLATHKCRQRSRAWQNGDRAYNPIQEAWSFLGEWTPEQDEKKEWLSAGLEVGVLSVNFEGP